MWFYLLINIGALIGIIGMVYAEKYVGFWLAYTLPTMIFLLCPIVLWIGRNKYKRSLPTGSALATVIRIWGLGMKGTWSSNPLRMWRNWTGREFWMRAKPENVVAAHGGVSPSWLTWDSEYVEEVKRGLKACQVFMFYPLYWLSFYQIGNSACFLLFCPVFVELNGC